MIDSITGTLQKILPTHAILQTGGTAFIIFISRNTYEQLRENPEGSKDIEILTHLAVSENALTLYGFAEEKERSLFQLLTKHVSGIGCKTALNILSAAKLEDFKTLVIQNDSKALAKLKGIGAKTAERICIELRGKVGVVETWEAQSSGPKDEIPKHDTVLALIALGYQKGPATKACEEAIVYLQKEGNPTPSTEDILKISLRSLA